MSRVFIVAAVFAAALSASQALAQSGGVYSLTWSTLDSGQTFSMGGVYQLGSTVGQADASPLAGGIYALNGGFWGARAAGTVDAPALPPAPVAFAARPPKPNPFHESTALEFDLPSVQAVSLVVFGVDGRVVRRLVSGKVESGHHRAIWDGRDEAGRAVPSGIYFAHLVAGEFSSTMRVVRID